MFKKRKWSKWEHVMFVERYNSASNTYEVFIKKCESTGLTKYKNVFVGTRVHNLHSRMTNWLTKN